MAAPWDGTAAPTANCPCPQHAQRSTAHIIGLHVGVPGSTQLPQAPRRSAGSGGGHKQRLCSHFRCPRCRRRCEQPTAAGVAPSVHCRLAGGAERSLPCSLASLAHYPHHYRRVGAQGSRARLLATASFTSCAVGAPLRLHRATKPCSQIFNPRRRRDLAPALRPRARDIMIYSVLTARTRLISAGLHGAGWRSHVTPPHGVEPALAAGVAAARGRRRLVAAAARAESSARAASELGQ